MEKLLIKIEVFYLKQQPEVNKKHLGYIDLTVALRKIESAGVQTYFLKWLEFMSDSSGVDFSLKPETGAI